jgi:S1-C subfamily serine protease
MIKKVLHIISIIVKSFIKGSVVALLILNMVLIINVAQLMNDLEAKTDTMVSAIQENKVPTLPNFENLVRANVVIYNISKGCMGAGTIINVNGKIYILSAGHLDDPDDTFFVKEGEEYRGITLVKVNHKVDLALFEYDCTYCDLTIAPIAVGEPKVGDKVWAIGNPACLEDAITSGTLVRKLGFNYLMDAKIYHGNSGGGLFNTKGELIGVNVAMTGIPGYMLGMTVNLSTVKAFVLGLIPNELDKG